MIIQRPFILLLALQLVSLSRAEEPLCHRLEIHIQNHAEWKDGWGTVQTVLDSTAAELWKYFPEHKLAPVEVWPKGGPISLYDRGPKGEYLVKLDTGDAHWAQYCYQFAHEFCHVLGGLKPHQNPNHWFEESLCELSSLFCLRALALTWREHAAKPAWKEFAPAFKTYADERLTHGALPAGQSLAQWFAENEQAMRKNSTDRERNAKVAVELLPLFEAAPEHWEAVLYINVERMTKMHSFKQYLEAWRRSSPEKHRAFIDTIAAKFALKLE